MDPIAVIAAATGIVETLGLDSKLGKLIAGDRGAEVAGRVVDAAQVVTGAKSVDEVRAAIEADGRAAAELRMRLLDSEEAERAREAADRADARAMQTAALAQDDLFSKRFVYLFAGAWSVFAMLYILLITVWDIPADNQRFADTILGFLLGTVIASLMQFFYGSSRGSQGKDTTLTALAETIRGRIRP